MNKRRIAILGSTGSIGRQALDVIRQHRDLFEVELLTANNSAELLISQALEFDANTVVICNESRYSEVAEALQPHYIKVFAGMKSVCDLVTSDTIDIVLTSMVGFSGLESTVAAVKAGKTIALANKDAFAALHDERAESEGVSFGGAFENLFFRQPVAVAGLVRTADSAVETVVSADIADFDQSADEDGVSVDLPPDGIRFFGEDGRRFVGAMFQQKFVFLYSERMRVFELFDDLRNGFNHIVWCSIWE